ncbi:DUF1080 domain-containing protein [bacterium]|nr:DUF1080 domain-containing protein [bacterium]
MNSTRFGQFIFIQFAALLPLFLANQALCLADDHTPKPAKEKVVDAPKSKPDSAAWKKLNGSWVVSQFGGDGPVEIKDDLITFGFGDPMTGIRWEGDLKTDSYEVELEARRTDGFDFFCGLTFPVAKNQASFILGGWGGGIVGISSIDGHDASENETTSFRNFDNDRWYKVRVRVDSFQIQCWIDDKLACDVPRADREFDIRYEMDQCVPLGIASFQCKSELRNLRLRELSKKEVAEAKKMSDEAKK